MKGIEENLGSMLDRGKRITAYLNRTVYRQYQNAQRERWMTEGESEGVKWKPLNPKYASRKLTQFAAYPGGGRKMMIATGRLFKSVVGPGEDHKKTVTDKNITVAWSTPYASEVNEVRGFSELSVKTMMEIYKGLGEFLIEGIIKDIK